jgi:hypothetical protein
MIFREYVEGWQGSLCMAIVTRVKGRSFWTDFAWWITRSSFCSSLGCLRGLLVYLCQNICTMYDNLLITTNRKLAQGVLYTESVIGGNSVCWHHSRDNSTLCLHYRIYFYMVIVKECHCIWVISAFEGIVVTNDGNAILREIDIAHPAAKVWVMFG